MTRDEERNLPRALTSLPRGMRILVLDAGSDDRTVEFAQAAGATVLTREWTNFVEARQFALRAVQTPWVLMIDADEAFDDVLRDALVAASQDFAGYRMRRTTYFCGRPMRIWRNELLLRLFRVGTAQLEAHPATGGSAPLHEAWAGAGPVAELPGTLLHFSYPDLASYRAKYERYTTLEAQWLDPSLGRFFCAGAAGAARFVQLLCGKGALLDGPRGWYVAGKSAFYPAVVRAKALARPKL